MRRRPNKQDATGAFLVMDKPEGLTSHDVVAIVRAVTGFGKVGHTGTLDPFATGVLPIALGAATRMIPFLDEDLKVYDATILLGSATDTGDLTGTVVREAAVPTLEREKVEVVLAGFQGTRMQTPPRYSAVKVGGRPLYSYARAGIEVEAKPRPTRIDGIDLLALEAPRLRVRIRCGRGTYARVLADEIAVELGTAGHLVALRRVQSGPFHDERAMSLETLARLVAGTDDWKRAFRTARGEPDRLPWAPRDQVLSGLAPHLLSLRDALGHLPVASVQPGWNPKAPPGPPAGVAVGRHYLVALGTEVLAVAESAPEGPRVARLVGG